MDAPRSDLLQGTLDVLILKIVELGPIHGYGIAQRIRQESMDVLQVQQGSLYPALHRLEKRGWLCAEWDEAETGRQAKFYALTRIGRDRLVAEVANWDLLSQAITSILRLRSPSVRTDRAKSS
jgi:PadR family transcriptional regulator PadR